MCATVTQRAQRWRANRSEEECEPIGRVESGRLALAALGPFKYRTLKEADRGPWCDPLQRTVCEEQACHQVILLARSFRRRLTLNKGAPRRKEFLTTLDQLEEKAGELARLLSGLDDMAIHYIQTAGSGIAGHREWFPTPLMKDADVDGLPTVGDDPRTCTWVRRLSALSQYLNVARTGFLVCKNIDSLDEPADKGGNTSLYKEIYGSPSWFLVFEGWHIYDLFKPDEATGHVDGPFHAFLKHVFEFATGLEPEEHSKLIFWLKKLCKANRDMKVVRLRENELGAELNMLAPTRANKVREGEIYAEQALLDQQHAKLWYEIYPSR